MLLTKRFHRQLLAEQADRFEAQLAEKERVLVTLSEQVDWLRQVLGRPALVRQEVANPSEQPPHAFGVTAPFMGEMEEEIEHLRKSGRLSEAQAAEFFAEYGDGSGPEL